MMVVRVAMHSHRNRSRIIARRPGHVLVLFAMLLFGIFALAALVIDIGFARLAQRQMQSAADAAALEGLRFRDHLPPQPLSQNMEEARRLQASAVVAQMFDDNLMSDEADAFAYGAGPIVPFTTGIGHPDLHASQTILLPSTPVYKPQRNDGSRGININLNNAVEGDMVAGGGYNPDADHSEGSGYARSDFVPSTGTSQGDAFLVRLRRSGETFTDDVGTSGPPLPYLFARGALVGRQFIGDGITARATAITDARPVVCVGQADSRQTPPLLGGLNIAVEFSQWRNLQVGETLSDEMFTITTVNTVGEEPVIGGEPLIGEGYVALYERVLEPNQPNPVNRVIGFAFGRYESMPNPQVVKLRLGSGPTQIAPENASAVFCFDLHSSIEVIDFVLQRQRATDVVDQLLLAPALVR